MTILPLARRAFALIPVLVCLVLVLGVVTAMQYAAWRALQGAATQWNGQRALYAANAAITEALATWRATAVADLPIGSSIESTDARDDIALHTSIMRSAPQIAVLSATAEPRDGGMRFRRVVRRVVRLESPALPMLAAVTVLGDGAIDGALIDARDAIRPLDARSDDCGALRDTLSSVPVRFIGRDSLGVRMRADFDRGWSTIAGVTSVVGEGLLDGGAWRAWRIGSGSRVTLTGTRAVRGVLAVDGDLQIDGTLQLEGLLLVRGALLTSSGRAAITGAVVIRDAGNSGITTLRTLQLQYNACLVGRALATVSVPRSAPFDTWFTP